MNPTDPNPLLPCPFCGDEMRITAFGSVRHSLEREHTCYIGATVFPLAKWNTRAPSELTHAQAAAMRAERDEARKERDKLSRQYEGKMPCGHLRQFGTCGEVFPIHCIACERDAANALVEAIKQEADKLHSECIRDGETDAYCLTSEQIAALAEVAKSLSPRITENTKPQ